AKWVAQMFAQHVPLDRAGEGPREVLSVDRVVGSHWFQQLLHRDEEGRYLRMPLVYHLVERRWIHVSGAFLTPETGKFFHKTAMSNESCAFCHNPRVDMRPRPIPGRWPGYDPQVGELGISCEACHGPGERHVRAHQNPAHRLAQHYAGEADPT